MLHIWVCHLLILRIIGDFLRQTDKLREYFYSDWPNNLFNLLFLTEILLVLVFQ